MRPVFLGILTALLTLVGGVGVAQASVYDIRGEWPIEAVCKGGCTFPKINEKSITAKVIFRKEEANGEFTGTAQLSIAAGTVVGTITGTQLSATIELSSPEGSIKMNLVDVTIDETTNTIAGEGPWQFGSESGKAIFTGYRLRTLEQVEQAEKEQRERKEREEKERQERQLQEEKEKKEQEESERKHGEEAKAKEAAEKEAQAKQREKEAQEQETRAENEVRENAERVARSRTEFETKERQNKEIIEREAKEYEARHPPGPATLVGKALALGGSGSLSLKLSNPNGTPVTGEIVLLAAGGHASKTGKAGATVLGKGSFTLSSHGTGTVKLKLSHTVVAELSHHRTLQAKVRVTTSLTGRPALVATYSVTVHGPAPKRG